MPKGIYKRTKPAWNKGKVGAQKHSDETKIKMSETHKRIGSPWLKGKVVPSETRKKMSETHKKLGSGSRLPKLVGENNKNWKGDDAGYGAKHDWVRSRFGKPNKCEFCGTTKSRFEWANVSGQYKRVRSDWKRLCKKCHIHYDEIPERNATHWREKRKN